MGRTNSLTCALILKNQSTSKKIKGNGKKKKKKSSYIFFIFHTLLPKVGEKATHKRSTCKENKCHLTNSLRSLQQSIPNTCFWSLYLIILLCHSKIWKSNWWNALQSIFPEWAYYTRITFSLSGIKHRGLSSIIWSCCSLILARWQNIQVYKNHILGQQSS